MTMKRFGYGALIGAAALFIALGSATTAEAAKKAKKQAAGPTYGVCVLQAQAPVCASKGKAKLSYANACFAQADGAKGAKAGACKPAKAAKKGGKKKSKKSKR